MGFVRKVLGVKAKAPAPEHHVDPNRGKRMAAAKAQAAQMSQMGRDNLKTDLEEDKEQTRSGIVI